MGTGICSCKKMPLIAHSCYCEWHYLLFGGKRALKRARTPLVDGLAVGQRELEHGQEVGGGDKHHRLGADFEPARDLVVDLGLAVLGPGMIDHLPRWRIMSRRLLNKSINVAHPDRSGVN